jgi:hypothetical protein
MGESVLGVFRGVIMSEDNVSMKEVTYHSCTGGVQLLYKIELSAQREETK